MNGWKKRCIKWRQLVKSTKGSFIQIETEYRIPNTEQRATEWLNWLQIWAGDRNNNILLDLKGKQWFSISFSSSDFNLERFAVFRCWEIRRLFVERANFIIIIWNIVIKRNVIIVILMIATINIIMIIWNIIIKRNVAIIIQMSLLSL